MKDAGGAAVAGEKKSINAELWQACAGPLVNLPAAGTHVVYFPQGHSEQVAVSMRKEVDAKIPSYPNLDSKLICLLHNVTLHADPETDEVYAQMTLQPVSSLDKDALLRSDLALKTNKPPVDFFCKTLTASDTSTHGGFSVPRRAAEKIFPTLDFSMQPPAQEIVARDLHDNVWTFRHIFRGQPKRHLLTTGWSLFVSGKRLFAGDSVLFIRDEKQQLLLGIRRATRQPTNLSSSVLSSDSMHIGILAAAAHAAANSSPFTVFFNPRSTASEFVIPLAKYFKAVCSYQISLGMRFRMVFETEESGTRRYMGTITGISDLDPLRWKNSQWRNLQVGWDESTAGDRRNRVSIWEIEPVTAPFFICPPFFRPKRPRQPGMLDDDSYDLDNMFKRTMPWLGDDTYVKDNQALPGFGLAHWMNAPHNTSMGNSVQPNYMQSLSGSLLQDLAGSDLSRQLGMMLPQLPQPSTSQLISKRILQQAQVNEHLPKLPSLLNPLGSVIKPHQHLGDTTEQSTQNLPSSVFSSQVQGQPQTVAHNNNILHQQSSVQNHQFHGNLPPRLQRQQQHLNRQQHFMGHNLETSLLQSQFPDLLSQQLSNNETQLQVLQKLQHQQHQQPLVAQQSALQQPGQLSQLQKTKSQLLDASQSLCRSMTANQMLELPQTTDIAVLQPSIIQQQIIGNSSQSNAQFTHSPQVLKLQQQNPGILSDVISHTGVLPGSVTNQLSTAGRHMLTPATVAGQSRISGDVPSCSVSPSTNSFRNMVQPANSRAHQSTAIGSDMAQSAGTVLSPSFPESIPCNSNLVKNLHHKSDVRPSLNVAENQNQECFGRQAYINGSDAQMDYLDTSSSTTSVCLSQNDVHLQQNHNSLSYIPQSALISTLENGLYGTSTDGHLAVPLNPEDQFTKGMVGLDKDFSYNLSPGVMLDNCEKSKDPQPELSSSMVSQSFDVPDMVFNSIDSTVNDISLSKRGSWAAVPQFQPMRTYTKVYKRGAVGRSIDISSYSGYNELKLDLAWRFGIEGQLEDHQRIGWKLVYVDHENDALLVGDDPWEEFVNCVRCIKILSPQEVQQMSLDGGLGNSIHQNQACSSSDSGNV